jgi:hypothetical protein
LIEQAFVVPIRPNDSEGIENLANHLLARMFNRETLQLVRDRDFKILVLIPMVMFCSNTQFELEILVFPINALEFSRLSGKIAVKCLPKISTQPNCGIHAEA